MPMRPLPLDDPRAMDELTDRGMARNPAQYQNPRKPPVGPPARINTPQVMPTERTAPMPTMPMPNQRPPAEMRRLDAAAGGGASALPRDVAAAEPGPEWKSLEDIVLQRAGMTRAGEAYRQVAEDVRGLVEKGVKVVGAGLHALEGALPDSGMTTVGEDIRGLAPAISKAAVPESPIIGGAMLGTGVAGGIMARAGVQGAAAIAARIAGGAAGGELGGQMEGKPPGTGALIGGGSAAAGEVLSTALNTMRAVGTARVMAAQQNVDAQKFGTAMEIIEPLFGGRRDPRSLYALTISNGGTGPQGIALLRQAQEAGEQRIGQLVQGKLFQSPIDPTKHVPYEQARKELAKLQDAAFGGSKVNPTDPTIKGLDAKAAYRAGVQNMDTWLARHDPTGEAAGLAGQLREQYKVGRGLLDVLGKGFKKFAHDDVRFNSNDIAKYLSDPKTRARVESRIGPVNMQKLDDVFFRGQGPGMVDQPNRPLGGDAAGKAMRRGPVPWPDAPGLVGNPRSLSPMARTGADIGMAAAADEVVGSELPPLKIPGR